MRPLEAFARWKDECTVYGTLPMEMRVKFGDFILAVFCSSYERGYIAGRAEGEVVGKMRAEVAASAPVTKPRGRKPKAKAYDPLAVGEE